MPGHARQTTHIELNYHKTFGEWTGKITGFADFEECSSYDIGADSVMPGAIMYPIYTDEVISDLNNVYNHQGVYQVQSWNDYTYGASAEVFRSYSIGHINGTLLIGTQFENYKMQNNTTSYGDSYNRILLTLSDNNRTIELGKETNLSGFFQIKANLLKNLVFNGGLRYDHKKRYNDRTLRSFSPRLSLIYKMNADMNLKVGYSQSFVDAPFYYRANNLSLYAGGSELDAERMGACQLTFNWNIKPLHLKYEANGYYNRLDNLIYYDATNQAQKVSNTGILNILGIENVLTYEYRRITATMNCSYQFVPGSINYAADGSHINNVPNFILNAACNYNVWSHAKYGTVKLRANVNTLSEQYNPIVSSMVYRGNSHVYLPYNKIKARAIVNAGADYELKNLSLSLNIYNVLGTDYYQGGSDRIPTPQQHRSLMINASYKF
jgi:outer membrane receptor for ferrienterochelin and colicins